MKKENDKRIEDFLKTFSLIPAPPGLKGKILHSTLHKRQSSPVLTPFLWRGLAGTLIFLIIVIAVDATISSSQYNRLTTFLKLPQESTAAQEEEEWSMLKNIIWEPLDSSGNTEKKKFYNLRKNSEINKRQLQWREILEEEFE